MLEVSADERIRSQPRVARLITGLRSSRDSSSRRLRGITLATIITGLMYALAPRDLSLCDEPRGETEWTSRPATARRASAR